MGVDLRSAVVSVCALLAVFSGSCTRDRDISQDPKRRLTEYISKSFAVSGVGDKKMLESYLTGDARARLAAWSDEQFEAAFIRAKRQFVKLVVRETKKVANEEVNITYELTYLDQGKGLDVRVTNKKLCTMVLEQGKWLIREVRNVKELIEYRNEMTIP
jgi:hypothetical protein